MQSLKDLFFKHLAQTSPEPILLEIESAKDIYLYDKNEKSYIDLISGISVSIIGHSNEHVIKAINKQASKYMHLMVYGEYVQEPQIKLAEKIAKITNQHFDSVFFVNSGSEAVEGALKLAKRYTGKKEIIACNNAYHGSTHGALSLINNNEYTEKFKPLLPNIKFINFNNISDLTLITDNTACVIVEPVQGEAGCIPANLNFLQTIRNKCNETGALLIFDEVQTGMGRTGSFFAYQSYNIIPDIIILAKAFGGGMPLGAFISQQKIMECLSHNPILGHISTFGGHPVSCAASLASIEVVENQKLIEQVEQKEKKFRKLLVHNKINEVRGKGLMLAIQLDSFETVKKIISHCLNKGLVCDWFLFCNSAIRISPPLIITNEQISYSCKIILDALDNL